MSAKIFFSYSHKDEELRDQLEVQLAMLKREGLVESWHDRRMIAGDVLDWTIDKNLDEADIILLLVSPDFLASDYCYKIEKARALERQAAGEARVISVILRPCDWAHTDLRKFLVTPRDGKPVTKWPDRDEAFLDIVQSIRAAIKAIGKAEAPLETHLWVDPVREQAAAALAQIPRSSNLRLKKQFTQADQDEFLLEAFTFMSRFFQASLDELQKRNAEISGRFRAIDANTFTAAIYRHGQKIEACTIRLGGFAGGISYSYGDDAHDRGINESLSVSHDEQMLFLKAIGMAHIGRRRESKLSHEGAAEYFWSLLMERLQ